MLFKDRTDAGRQLAPLIAKYKHKPDTLILGLARGGVVVAQALAQEIDLPFNVIVVRKIGAPGNEELAIGAISETGEGIFNENLVAVLGVTSDYIKREVERQKKIAQERLALYRKKRPLPPIKDKTLILVDDGIATGASMRVAIKSVKAAGAKKIILAVPVAAPDSFDQIAQEVDEAYCLSKPHHFEAVGVFYRTFPQTTDAQVLDFMN